MFNKIAYLLRISIIEERVQDVNLRELGLFIEFASYWYGGLSVVRDYVVFGVRRRRLESSINAPAHCLLKGYFWAKGVDRPLGQDPLVMLGNNLGSQTSQREDNILENLIPLTDLAINE